MPVLFRHLSTPYSLPLERTPFALSHNSFVATADQIFKPSRFGSPFGTVERYYRAQLGQHLIRKNLTLSLRNPSSSLMLRTRVIGPLFLFLQSTSKNTTFSTWKMTPAQRSQVIHAPSDEASCHAKSIFLAGTTTQVDTIDWRKTLSASLADLSVTIYNPHRLDWDSSWHENIKFAPYREQVEWELDRQNKADIVVFYFHPSTQAAVSLLELGIWVRIPGKTIVVCPEGYWKRGNVEIVCKKFDVEMVDNLGGLRDAIVKKLSLDA